MAGPCAKQVVLCSIHDLDTGKVYWGENDCEEPQDVCPRGNLAPGVGYDICVNVCKQRAHAEERAAAEVGRVLNNAIATVYGQTRVCKSCEVALLMVGVRRIILLKDSDVLVP